MATPHQDDEEEKDRSHDIINASHNHNHTPVNNIPLLTCALLAALTTGGPVYAFGLYGAELKEKLHLTQSQLDTISSANFCAGLLSWIPGLMVDTCGVRFSLTAGGLLGATFMMGYWAVAKQILVLPGGESHILPALCALGVLCFMTNGLVIGSIFKLIVSTCAPHTKGSAVGAAKGYVGLGSGVYACLFRALKTPQLDDLDFLPLAAILAVTMGSIPAWILLPPRDTMQRIMEMPSKEAMDRTTANHLRVIYCGLICLVLLVVASTVESLVQDVYGSDKEENVQEHPQYSHVVVIMMVWLAPILSLLVLPLKATTDDGEDTEDIDDDNDDDSTEMQPLVRRHSSPALAYGAEITATVQLRGIGGLLGKKIENDDHVPNLTLRQMLQTPAAWIFAWVAVVRVGGGTAVTNNMSQMVESLYLPHHTTTPAGLALFSVAQAVSRVATGAVSDWALSWDVQAKFVQNGAYWDGHGVPRPAFLIVASAAGVMAQLFMSIATTRNLFLLGICFSGAAFGMIWPLMVLIVGEVFGTANMGANYMFFDGLSSALGTLLVSKYITQEVYERHIEGEGNRTCYGQACFFESHMITAALSLTCVVASFWFYRSTRHVYAKRAF